jgi:DNA (cytosine-5)-methyltransferase 1
MNELALFAGAGGGILGGVLLGWRTICAVENDPYARSVLLQRQNDGILAPFPVWDDVRTFDGRQWRGIVDVVSGGFPCQDIRSAGAGAGIDGARSGLWREMARVVCEVRPAFVFVENSPMLTSRGLGTVLGALAEMGYDAEWGVLGADDAGAPHIRKRIWILAYSQCLRWREGGVQGHLSDSDREHDDACGHGAGAVCGEQRQPAELSEGKNVSDANGQRFEKQRCSVSGFAEESESEFGLWWRSEPDVGRVVNGVAARVDRLRAIGNGQVPAVVRKAWHVLCQRAAAEHYGSRTAQLTTQQWCRLPVDPAVY